MSTVIEELRDTGRWGTAHIYQATGRSFLSFLRSPNLLLCRMTPALLREYEEHLRQKGLKWNTVSTYMKTLRALYNRGVARRWTPAIAGLFTSVYTGTRADIKRALPALDMCRLLKAAEAKVGHSGLTTGQRNTCRLFCLMFLLRGIPFVDLISLRRDDYSEGIITYCRRKTGRVMRVAVSPEAQRLIDELTPVDQPSAYLLPVMHHAGNDAEFYKEYQTALRRMNGQLKLLSRRLGVKSSLSSYSARHTWATMAYYCEIHPGIISEAMGHSSITVTETYLKPFREERIDAANRQVISYVRSGGKSVRA